MIISIWQTERRGRRMIEANEETVNGTSTVGLYHLRLEGAGLLVDREVDEGVALRIIAAVMGGGVPAPRVLSGGDGEARAGEPERPVQSGTPIAGLSARGYID